MQISVVIPTCNRPQRLLKLLENLEKSSYKVFEVIVVDSGEKRLTPSDYLHLKNFVILYLDSEKSVCVQRNIGISKAKGDWIFVCDDDIEVPSDYLEKISTHVVNHSEAGAVSGLVLQKERNEWRGTYPVTSALRLAWKFIFQMSIWGEIKCRKNFITEYIKNFYVRKGNHISRAGWPVLTDFSGDYFETPVYGLGASMLKKEWLMSSRYDEVLDRHGIGDNYGVAVGFPGKIHVLPGAFVFHHQETTNRLYRPLQYFRRVLALDYFVSTNEKLHFVKKRWLLWSLTGNLIEFIFVRDKLMIRPAVKSIVKIIIRKNPYLLAARENKRITEPMF